MDKLSTPLHSMHASHTFPFLSVPVRSQNLPDQPVWEPTRRIRNAQQKLDGFNPAALLVDDLKQNPAVDKFNSLAAGTCSVACVLNLPCMGQCSSSDE